MKQALGSPKIASSVGKGDSMDLKDAIPIARDSVVAVFRYRIEQPSKPKKGKVRPAKVDIGWGSGFCIDHDRYVATAFHVLNGGKPRNPADKFLVFVVPGNGDPAYHFPVVGFPIERPESDLAVLEIGPCVKQGIHLPALPVSFAARPDGARVVTIGFPAPEVHRVDIDPAGTYRGGQFFLKSHANEGIISAQYTVGNLRIYEFNVGWHHGESGGPVLCPEASLAAFTIMQQYRNVKSPHGVLAGPHRGCALSAIEGELMGLGIHIV